MSSVSELHRPSFERIAKTGVEIALVVGIPAIIGFTLDRRRSNAITRVKPLDPVSLNSGDFSLPTSYLQPQATLYTRP